jgi:hypothetical protein
MQDELAEALIERDWSPFLEQARRLCLGVPVRTGIRVDISVRPVKSDQDFAAVLFCDDYDSQAPLLDFCDPAAPASLGAEHWPRMSNAPMNSIPFQGRQVPILCTPGTRGYHLHSSHHTEDHPRTTWRLANVASLLSMFMRMGTYQGRGVA